MFETPDAETAIYGALKKESYILLMWVTKEGHKYQYVVVVVVVCYRS